MKMYHVAPKNYETGQPLTSLSRQMGDAAIDTFISRWPEAADLAAYHVEYVHCHDTLQDAVDYASGIIAGDVVILEINADAMERDLIDVERDVVEYDHPIVRGEIATEYLSVVDV